MYCLRPQPGGSVFRGGTFDYLIAVGIALPLALSVGFLFTCIIETIGWFVWLLALLTAPKAAEIIVEGVRWGVSKRCSRYLADLVGSCVGLSMIPFIIFLLFIGDIYGLIGLGLFALIAVRTTIARLR